MTTKFSEEQQTFHTARLLDWLNDSTGNFMAVDCMSRELEQAGFERLELSDAWVVEPGGKYYVVRNSTAIFAFVAGSEMPEEGGFHIIAAHSDSPGFKLKPNPEMYGEGGTVSLNVEKYGGGIMYTWFDRPLSMCARLQIAGDDALNPREVLVDLDRPVAVIPHLAIHFNRGVNEGNPLSVQKDMKPVIGIYPYEEYRQMQKMGGVVKCMLADAAGVAPEDVLAMEVQLYPYEEARLAGSNDEYLMSGRIDDLSMAFCALSAMLQTADEETASTRIMAIFDNEETGSCTRQGAAAPTLRNIMERITNSLTESLLEESADERDADMGITDEEAYNPERFYRALEQSFLISADDAHAYHPNYGEKYDPTNHPVIGGGPVVKINANCKYMTDSRGAAIFSALCRESGVECQYFVNHGDVAGGSTLGNILTSQLDIAGVDMGCAIWAMHSACETAGIDDHIDTIAVFSTFYAS